MESKLLTAVQDSDEMKRTASNSMLTCCDCRCCCCGPRMGERVNESGR